MSLLLRSRTGKKGKGSRSFLGEKKLPRVRGESIEERINRPSIWREEKKSFDRCYQRKKPRFVKTSRGGGVRSLRTRHRLLQRLDQRRGSGSEPVPLSRVREGKKGKNCLG